MVNSIASQGTDAKDDWTKKYDAPDGSYWECQACGKHSLNRANGPLGWDVSCFLNAMLIEAAN